ncbi:retrovirus-related pol polyprotein from transposon TNT 1-94 [Tanacetum coccineum]|uniref:Retrovirus-related pol polyprotein from transposon TNT 1-94 n=1 Tax=Tanacetum coccineum TaxID=301880 RepID=A0ABQ4WFX5_9ASTR
MTTLADKAILSGADNRPPMLEKDMYDSWKNRMELYMMNRQHERMILESVESGPLIWPSIEENGVTRPNKYSELSATEAIQADCDVKATNIILQGLPPEVYALIYPLHSHDMNLNMKLEQFQVNTKFLNTLPPEWSKFVTDVKLVRDLHTTNIDQLHAYLGQHEFHANEAVVQNFNSSPQQDALISSVIEQLKTQVVNCTKINLENKSVNDTLTTELERYKEQVKVLKEGQNIDLKSKDNVFDSCAYLFGLSEFMNSTEPTLSSRPIKFEVPKELPKVSMVHTSLKKLKHHLAGFDVVVKERTTTIAITEGSWGFEHTKAYFRDEIIPFVKALKDLFNTLNQYFVDELSEVQNVFHQMEQEKVLVITTLKDDLRKLKGKALADNDVTKHTIDPEMLKIDEEAAILREIVEQGKSQNPLNTSLDSALAVTPKNKDKRVRFTEPVTSSGNTITKTASTSNLVSNKPMLSSTGVKPSTSASGSQPSGNTKKDKIQQTPSSTQKNKVEAHPRKVKSSLKNKDCVVAPKGTANVQHSKLNANSELKCVKCNGCMLSDNHDLCVLDFINNVNARVKSKSVKKSSKRKVWKPTGKVFTNIGYIWRPTGRTFTIVGNACPLTRITTTTEVPLRKPTDLENETPKPVVTLVYSRKPRKSKTNVPVSKSKVVQIVLWYLDSGCSKHMTGDRSQLTNFVNKFLGTVKFGNDHVAKILGYGDYQIGNVTISRVYYVEGLGHNLFSVGQFCDSNLEVAFRQHTCFIRNLEGVDLLTGSRGNNLYTLSLRDMMASSPICLLSKASKTKSWLWHRRLSHLNFGAINHLARHGLVRGLPKLKFEKDHLCSACAMGKSKKKPHKPKSEDTNQEKLYLLHMDLCGPMRVASVNGKKYNLVIVDDYSRFTWVKCLKSKDEALDFIIKFLKMIQKVDISHETSVARSPQQNGVVEKTGILFQPLFDELLNPSSSVDCPAPEKSIALIAEVVAPEPDASTGSPSSTTVDQDAPSPSNSQTTPETQSPIIPNDVEEDNHDLDVTHMNNDLFFGIPIPENDSEASRLGFELKNYKDALTQACWIEAMQEELHEFDRLEVWKLVPHPDKVMIITLKLIYKVKLDEMGGILKNKAHCCILVTVKKRELILRNPLLQ